MLAAASRPLVAALPLLIAGRIAQGVGAAGILAAGPALITLARPAAERLGALGTYTLAFGIAGAVAPLLGGAVIPSLDWAGATAPALTSGIEPSVAGR